MGQNKDEVKDYSFPQSVLIKNMDEQQRPREKAMRLGFEALTTEELMAIIFSTGIKGRSVIDVCRDILNAYEGKISGVMNESADSLCRKHKGIGIAKATTLLAGIELGKRAAREKDEETVKTKKLLSSQIAYQYMRAEIANLQHEEFWVAMVDRAGRAMKKVQISKGGTAATTVDVKLIMKAALECLASSIILYHNHPSGNLNPSPEDDRLTRKIVDAGKLLDIRVNDHIIITYNNYYSYCDNGRI